MEANKRLASDLVNDPNTHDEAKNKRIRSMPSFASVIGEVMMVKSFDSFCKVLEPMLRKVVNEEVELGLQKTLRSMSRTPSFRIQAPEPAASLKLIFTNKVLPTIFTCHKVLDVNGAPLQLVLVEQRGEQMTPILPPYPMKVEIVVVDGDFLSSDRDKWTLNEFNRSLVKERAFKRPLLTKEINYTMKDTSFVTLGEIEFTDNSSWIRSRKFRLAARVLAETSSGSERVLEAVTEAFVVKDQRGELYKKHYPPKLEDEVWRLEKIGKDGKFHKRLTNAGVNNVQKLLKLSVINPSRLKMILGGRSTEISQRMWDVIVKHARTCDLGNKLYISSESYFTITLDPICQIFSIKIDDQLVSISDLNISLKNEVEKLVKDAYENWDSLEEVDRSDYDNFQQPQGNMLVAECDNLVPESLMPYEILIGGIIEVGDADQLAGWNASAGRSII